MKLIYRAKYLLDETKTLKEVGIKANEIATIHLVSRFEGGAGSRPVVQEIAYQLKEILRQVC